MGVGKMYPPTSKYGYFWASMLNFRKDNHCINVKMQLINKLNRLELSR